MLSVSLETGEELDFIVELHFFLIGKSVVCT